MYAAWYGECERHDGGFSATCRDICETNGQWDTAKCPDRESQRTLCDANPECRWSVPCAQGKHCEGCWFPHENYDHRSQTDRDQFCFNKATMKLELALVDDLRSEFCQLTEPTLEP